VSDLLTRNVFLDTQVYIRNGFNLESRSLRKLGELCSDKQIQLLTTNIVQKEAETHLTDSIHKALTGLKSFKRQGAILRNVDIGQIKSLFVDVNEEETLTHAINAFKSYFKRCHAHTISAVKVNSDEVIDLYFKQSPPFGKADKKSEFPDAFNLLSLEKYAVDNNCKVYVVSDDGDLEKWCGSSKRLLHVSTLERYLDIYNQAEERLTLELHAAIDSNVKWLLDSIKDKAEDIGAYSDADWESDVTDFHIEHVEINDVSVLQINEKKATVSLDVSLRYFA